jgi:hypothetical protein
MNEELRLTQLQRKLNVTYYVLVGLSAAAWLATLAFGAFLTPSIDPYSGNNPSHSRLHRAGVELARRASMSFGSVEIICSYIKMYAV